MQLTCPHGHHWEVDLTERSATLGDLVLCPRCGAPVSVPLAVAAAPTLPPHAPLAHFAPDPHAATLPPPLASLQDSVTDRPPPSVLPAGIDELPAALLNHPRYRILCQIGAGGMGAVYKAEHLLMERIVALKLVSRALTDSPTTTDRFVREMKAAARLSHPNIVTAFDADQVGDVHFLVMEYVEGQSLAKVVAERGPLAIKDACEYVRQAAIGLEHAFEKGMVHRDVKPQNLMVTPQGVVKILDFGLARYVRELESEGVKQVGVSPTAAIDLKRSRARAVALAHTMTQAGAVMGTPDYIAPEQVHDASSADIRADIYSLGCTLYYLLTGKVPFQDDSLIDKLMAHQERAPASLAEQRPDVPARLAAIVDKMMAKRPEDRYQTPGEVARALEPFTREATGGSSSSLKLRRPTPGAPVKAPVVEPADSSTVDLTPKKTDLRRYRAPRAPRTVGVMRTCLGCGIATVVGVAVLAGIATALFWIGSEKVKDIASVIGNTRDTPQLWSVLADGWQPPAPDVRAEEVFPKQIAAFPGHRLAGVSLGKLKEPINLDVVGASATYDDGRAKYHVFAARVEQGQFERLKEELQAEINRTKAGFRSQNSFGTGSTWRSSFVLGDVRAIAWHAHGWLFLVHSRDDVSVADFMVALLRAIGQADLTTTPSENQANRLPAPKPIAPIGDAIPTEDGALLVLRWSAVAGARLYKLEVEDLDAMHVIPLQFPQPAERIAGELETAHAFAGRRGRWRVWAVDQHDVDGAKSAWAEFVIQK